MVRRRCLQRGSPIWQGLYRVESLPVSVSEHEFVKTVFLSVPRAIRRPRKSSEDLAVRAPRKRAFVGALVCVLLAACSGFRSASVDEWPAGLPPSNYFVSSFEEDEALQQLQTLDEYLSWVKSFYAGTLVYSRGWNAVSEEILGASYDRAQKALRKQVLYMLGRDIAVDWSKANSIRHVDSRHLAIWGSAAGRAIDEGDVDETLAKIGEDLELLLSESLDPDTITAARYHPQDPEDWFAF